MTEIISNETRFLHAIEMGLGAWQFGDRVMWGYGQTHNESDIHAAFQTSLEEGIRFIDTAEVYSMGKSERFLGEMLKAAEQPVLIATKFFPYPWRVHRWFMKNALQNSLERLGLERVDLYQIHWPSSLLPVETLMDWMAGLVKDGLVRTVGVSNFNPSQTLRAYTIQPLLKLMTKIGQDHGGKSNAQVALNWCICKGTMPIPGAKNAEQARQNAGALGWKLTPEQVAALDAASDEVTK